MRINPGGLIAQAKMLLAACKQIDPKMRLGTVTQEEFAQQIVEIEAIQAEIQTMELRITDLRNKRDAWVTRVWDQIKRTRSNVKGTYGDDSNEYELVGGTRASERKRPVRKPAKKAEA